jgi:bifunctional non-homologous end joining protein LigD
MTKRPRKPLLADDNPPLKSRPIRKRDRDQPNLSFDPMPERVQPCLALLKSKPPRGDEWTYEIKWDGYRLAIHIEPGRIRLITRGGHDWTQRFPAIAEAARALGPVTMILDGEAVVLDDAGRSDFGLLQRSLGAKGKNAGRGVSHEAVFYASDLLYLDGHDLTATEYRVRRHLLEDALPQSDGAMRISEEIDADPEALLQNACELGLEGIIAKHADRPYRSGRTGDWQKIKCSQSEAFVVVGYEPSTAVPGSIASLLLAAYRGDEFVHVGNVGTGFTHDEARRLLKTLDRLKVRKPVVAMSGAGIVFTSPTLIAEIEFRAWTSDGKLRHPSYKGLRDRQDNADIFRLDD